MQEPILISITGMDRPGITATVTQILSDFDADVLDIGQSVIHDSLSLGMLVQIPEQETDRKAVMDAVHDVFEQLLELGLFARVLPAVVTVSPAAWKKPAVHHMLRRCLFCCSRSFVGPPSSRNWSQWVVMTRPRAEAK